MYHFALNGRAFAVITEHFPQLIQKVLSCFCTLTRCFAFLASVVVMTFFLPHGGAAARAKSHRVRTHGARPEDPAGGGPAGH